MTPKDRDRLAKLESARAPRRAHAVMWDSANESRQSAVDRAAAAGVQLLIPLPMDRATWERGCRARQIALIEKYAPPNARVSEAARAALTKAAAR